MIAKKLELLHVWTPETSFQYPVSPTRNSCAISLKWLKIQEVFQNPGVLVSYRHAVNHCSWCSAIFARPNHDRAVCSVDHAVVLQWYNAQLHDAPTPTPPAPDFYAVPSRNIETAQCRPHADRPFLLTRSPLRIVRKASSSRLAVVVGWLAVSNRQYAATYSMHTLCTTHGTLAPHAACARQKYSFSALSMSLAMFTAAHWIKPTSPLTLNMSISRLNLVTTNIQLNYDSARATKGQRTAGLYVCVYDIFVYYIWHIATRQRHQQQKYSQIQQLIWARVECSALTYINWVIDMAFKFWQKHGAVWSIFAA